MASLITNPYAGRDYETLETIEAGLELTGFEVKAAKHKGGSLRGAYIVVRHGSLWLEKAYLPPYQEKNTPTDYDPYRSRRLLVGKADIIRLANKSETDGLTLIPLSLYNAGRFLKLQLALARGKKKHDKRESVKRRELDRHVGRIIRRGVADE
jgi:SsrA-binding protein